MNRNLLQACLISLLSSSVGYVAADSHDVSAQESVSTNASDVVTDPTGRATQQRSFLSMQGAEQRGLQLDQDQNDVASGPRISTGTALKTVADGKLYVHTETGKLAIYDLSVSGDPGFLGEVALPGSPEALFVRGNLAVVLARDVPCFDVMQDTTTYTDQVLTVDVTHPAHAFLVAQTPLAEPRAEISGSFTFSDFVVSPSGVEAWMLCWDYDQEDVIQQTFLHRLDLSGGHAALAGTLELPKGSQHRIVQAPQGVTVLAEGINTPREIYTVQASTNGPWTIGPKLALAGDDGWRVDSLEANQGLVRVLSHTALATYRISSEGSISLEGAVTVVPGLKLKGPYGYVLGPVAPSKINLEVFDVSSPTSVRPLGTSTVNANYSNIVSTELENVASSDILVAHVMIDASTPNVTRWDRYAIPLVFDPTSSVVKAYSALEGNFFQPMMVNNQIVSIDARSLQIGQLVNANQSRTTTRAMELSRPLFGVKRLSQAAVQLARNPVDGHLELRTVAINRAFDDRAPVLSTLTLDNSISPADVPEVRRFFSSDNIVFVQTRTFTSEGEVLRLAAYDYANASVPKVCGSVESIQVRDAQSGEFALSAIQVSGRRFALVALGDSASVTEVDFSDANHPVQGTPWTFPTSRFLRVSSTPDGLYFTSFESSDATDATLRKGKYMLRRLTTGSTWRMSRAVNIPGWVVATTSDKIVTVDPRVPSMADAPPDLHVDLLSVSFASTPSARVIKTVDIADTSTSFQTKDGKVYFLASKPWLDEYHSMWTLGGVNVTSSGLATVAPITLAKGGYRVETQPIMRGFWELESKVLLLSVGDYGAATTVFIDLSDSGDSISSWIDFTGPVMGVDESNSTLHFRAYGSTRDVSFNL